MGPTGSAFSQSLKTSLTYTFGAVSAYTYVTTTVTLTGASVGDPVIMGVSTPHPGITYYAWVSAPNTVTIKAHNLTPSSITTPNSTVFKIVVLPYVDF